MTAVATDADAQHERRLHPWSWLFVLLQQLRQFIVPLVALLVFGGRGDGDGDGAWEPLASLVAVAALVLTSLLQYLTFRYRIGEDGLSVRSGWLHRSVREIPFARVHNVVVHQSLLHRLFGVAEVRLESAGGSKPEAEMRVLRLDQALSLEQQVRHRGATLPPEIARQPQHTLLAMSPGEVVRLGLVSNRGMVAVAAALGASYQVFPRDMVADFIDRYSREIAGYASHLHLDGMATVLALVSFSLLAMLVLRGLSVLLALLQYHGFRLSEAERRLTVERGLLARLRTSVARRRVQAWTLQEGVLHRLMGRRSLRVDTAVADPRGQNTRALKELAPLATPAACDALVRHLLPHVQWPPAAWEPIPVRHWWRMAWPGAIAPVVLAAGLAWRWGAWGLLPLAWLPWAAFSAWREARRMAWAADEALVAVRGGWWTRWWRFAEVDKLQSLRLSRSPLDRRLGTASLWLDTAGATGGGPPLQLRFLPLADAQALHARLGQALAHRRLRW